MAFVTEIKDRVGHIRFGFGSANAMGVDFLAGLEAAFDAVSAADAVVLTGDGTAFSAGLDLPALLALDEPSVSRLIQDFCRLMEKVFLWPAPTIAALNGHAIAGGFVLAGACDVRLLARGSAKLGMTGVALGIAYPSLVTSMLQYTVPKASWHTVLLEGRLFSADSALAAQLVDEVVEPEVLWERALERARALAMGDRDAYARTKRMLKWDAVTRARELAAESYGAFVAALFVPSTRARLTAAVERLKTKR
ncbi:MAG: enoyl-CoA hydratase/isomerase family protein [Deltaproteobacteria bacterium]|nr:enoyl-CoA hydratase/isomerase family protein [Deltaproteobacteria bacterium]